MFRPLLAFCLVVLLGATSAQALVQRAYVSALTGNDANTATDCQATAPCRWFAGAISVVASGGEIVAMDSGAYGTVTITKSIAIVGAPGVYAGITVFAGSGVTIATAGVDVVLRGLTINNLGSSGSGIYMTAGNSLVVQNCVVTNFTSGNGLYVATSARVRVLDSLLRGSSRGAYFANGPTALVSGSRFLDNSDDGLYAYAGTGGTVTRVEVSRSELSGSGDSGIEIAATGGGRVELNLKDSVVSRNDYGVYATSVSGTGILLASVSNNLISGNTIDGLVASSTGAKLVASGNKVTHNATGLAQYGSAVLQTTGDNTVTDNTAPSVGTITGLANM